MSNKKAFLTGTNGQDGRTLSEFLLSKGYDVYGLLRRNSVAESQDSRIAGLPIKTYYGDLTDASGLEKIIQEVKPDEIYNLGAMSHVRVSFDTPGYTFEANSIGTFNVIEAVRKYVPNAKYYQSSSSEMYGLSVNENGFQNEQTTFNPVSPYGISKVFGYHLTRHYRRAYKMFAVNGILFNHSGQYRSSAFVEAKIVKAACEIKLGLRNKLELGNLDSYRDIGNSRDYTRAMWMMMQHSEPDDFVVATGDTYSIRDICEGVFRLLELPSYTNYVQVNEKYFRSEELPYLKGDSTKIRKTLGWEPKYTFENTLREMINYWFKQLSK